MTISDVNISSDVNTGSDVKININYNDYNCDLYYSYGALGFKNNRYFKYNATDTQIPASDITSALNVVLNNLRKNNMDVTWNSIFTSYKLDEQKSERKTDSSKKYDVIIQDWLSCSLCTNITTCYPTEPDSVTLRVNCNNTILNAGRKTDLFSPYQGFYSVPDHHGSQYSITGHYHTESTNIPIRLTGPNEYKPLHWYKGYDDFVLLYIYSVILSKNIYEERVKILSMDKFKECNDYLTGPIFLMEAEYTDGKVDEKTNYDRLLLNFDNEDRKILDLKYLGPNSSDHNKPPAIQMLRYKLNQISYNKTTIYANSIPPVNVDGITIRQAVNIPWTNDFSIKKVNLLVSAFWFNYKITVDDYSNDRPIPKENWNMYHCDPSNAYVCAMNGDFIPTGARTGYRDYNITPYKYPWEFRVATHLYDRMAKKILTQKLVNEDKFIDPYLVGSIVV
jgi:hypothetical protein